MRTPSVVANVTIFLLFFGLALLDALSSGRWLVALVWTAVGMLLAGAGVVARRRAVRHGVDRGGGAGR